MSYSLLAALGVTVRPFSGPKPAYGWKRSQFSAPFTSTVKLLARELDFLYAERIVLEAGFTEGQLRADGFPKANVRMDDEAIALAFESKHGPLRYATAEFNDWQDNLRAIALAMEALRAVDRYGVSKRGEQYQGWRAIPQSTDAVSEIQTPTNALNFLATYLDRDLEGDLAGDLREALMKAHPDRGGNTDDFRRVMRCKELLA